MLLTIRSVNMASFDERYVISYGSENHPVKRYRIYTKPSGVLFVKIGVYTRDRIPKGMYMDIPVLPSKIADPMYPDFRIAFPDWDASYRKYHNERDVEKRVNCKLVMVKDRVLYVALRDIEANEELLRCHSFAEGLIIGSRWLLQDNIDNYLKFLRWWLLLSNNKQHRLLLHTYNVLMENRECLRHKFTIKECLSIIKNRYLQDNIYSPVTAEQFLLSLHRSIY
jgi:hypothetical protein